MNRELAEAVVASFREQPVAHLRERFVRFRKQDWLRTTHWLHTSGLALYFLRRLKEMNVGDVMPQRLLRELENLQMENVARTNALFHEFIKVNMEFQRAKLNYANVKGFSLAPRAYPDLSYRYQQDLDFLVSPQDADRCHKAVMRLGYRLKREYEGSWEFVAGTPEVLSMRDLYRVRKERCLEIHFISSTERSDSDLQSDRLSRLQLQMWNGFEFPALSECDKLLGQAQHLFRHLQSEWTRTAWMLEFANAAQSHQGDKAFWDGVVALIDDTPQKRLGIGVAVLIASRTFASDLPSSFLSATVDQLPSRVRFWIDSYQDDVVYAEHPGSKLYLLLQDALAQERPDSRSRSRRSLFPVHLPPRIAFARRGSGPATRLRAIQAQIRFTWLRLRFHVTSGIRYKIESTRWKKVVDNLHG